MTPDDLGALFATFERSAFRLEARDTYSVPDEDDRLAAFLAGHKLPSRTPENDEWLALVQRATTTGRRMVRVRVVGGPPFTDYTAFEMAAYPENVAAGEDVRLVRRATLPRRDHGWAEDFWLFDDRTAVVLRYDDDGRFLGVEEGADVMRYQRIEREVLARSVELADWGSRAAGVGR